MINNHFGASLEMYSVVAPTAASVVATMITDAPTTTLPTSKVHTTQPRISANQSFTLVSTSTRSEL